MASSSSGDPVERARETCLRVLEHRPHSRLELLTKLRRKGIPDGVSNPVLDRLTEVGLVDDDAFARAWVASRQRRRPQGRRGLQAELLKRGVHRDIVTAVLEDTLNAEDALAAAQRALAPKTAQLRGLAPDAAQRKAAQFLLRRGFDYETARLAVERALKG